MADRSGVYAIINIINGGIYVGSAIRIFGRRTDHFRDLLNQKHKTPKLQNAYNKYGVDAFRFVILSFIDNPTVSDLRKKEQYFIDYFGIKNVYNTNPASDSWLGRKHSEESKKKMSEAQTKYFNKKYGNLRLVRRIEKEIRALNKLQQKFKKLIKIEEAKNKPTPRSAEYYEMVGKKISASLKGRKASTETRAKQSVAKKGKTVTHNCRPFQLRSPEGIVYDVLNAKAFCAKHGLEPSCVSILRKGKVSQHKGWTLNGTLSGSV